MFDLPAPCTSVPSLNVTDQVSHLYNTRVKIVVLCVCIFIFLDSKQEDKRFWTKPQQTFSGLLGECNFQLSLSHIQILHSLYHDSFLHLEGDTQICTEFPRCLVLLQHEYSFSILLYDQDIASHVTFFIIMDHMQLFNIEWQMAQHPIC